MPALADVYEQCFPVKAKCSVCRKRLFKTNTCGMCTRCQINTPIGKDLRKQRTRDWIDTHPEEIQERNASRRLAFKIVKLLREQCNG